MKTVQHFTVKMRDRKGAVAVIVAVLLVVLIGFIALAVDVGYIMVTRNELQNVADAAALAGARELGLVYKTLSYTQQQSYACDRTTIVPTVKETALKNKAAGTYIIINDSDNNGDISIGDWNTITKTFTPTLNQPDAVRVISRRDSSANNPVTTFFAKILGINETAVSARAIAALTGAGKVDPGDIKLPIGISSYKFESEFCDTDITFNPTNDIYSCGGWTTFDLGANDNNLRKDILLGEVAVPETYSSPEITANETSLNFIGGNLSDNTFDAFRLLFNKYGQDTNADGVVDFWSTLVAVYSSTGCSNPNKSQLIVGFATVEIYEVIGAPAKTIKAHIICDYVEPDTNGGGGEYGTKGDIPNLVQ
jgi:hypothetical protein